VILRVSLLVWIVVWVILKMPDMTKVAGWYDIESNKWFMVFECDEENYKQWEKEEQELEDEI